MDIDAVIAEGSKPAAAAQPEKVDAEVVEEAATETPDTEAAEPTAPEEEPKEETFPKKAVNALSRRDKQIGKLRAQLEQERQENARLRPKPATETPKSDAEPKESDFETYGDYLKAVARYEAKNLMSESQKQTAEDKAKTDAQAWESERAEVIDDNAEAAKKAFPDFEDVMKENADELAGIAPHVRRAVLEAENGAFALYALAKEGTLESLNAMSPMKVAMTIARMEDKGIALSKKQTITKAPTPMSPAKGTATTSKSVESMSTAELLKWAQKS